MYKMTIALSDRMHDDCTRRFPEQRSQIERDIVAWRALDAKEIEATERRFAAMVKRSPKLGEQFPTMVKQGYENKMVYPFRNVDPAIEVKVVRDYCKQYFNELATGVWRKRTPKVYEYLR